ncbi:MAG: hypothetical protein LBL23_06120 [Coriobacteriales bacterium]|jgi:hypothetical protein|nr:hypothetical protein [Coriobacteriales bacterium]
MAAVSATLLGCVLALALASTLALPALLLSGCATEANAEQSDELAEDPNAALVSEKETLTEQLELRKAELEQKELELESAEGMLAALSRETHPDEELQATYEKLVETVKADIEKLKAEIARLETRLAELDKILNGEVEATGPDDGNLEDLLPEEELQGFTEALDGIDEGSEPALSDEAALQEQPALQEQQQQQQSEEG